MVFTHPDRINRPGYFVIDSTVTAKAHPCLAEPIFRECWHGFTFHKSLLKVEEKSEYVFSIGSTEPLPLDGKAYAIRVTPTGICVSANNRKDLIHGFVTLLDCIRLEDTDGGERL